jgi:hypothetical protein
MTTYSVNVNGENIETFIRLLEIAIQKNWIQKFTLSIENTNGKTEDLDILTEPHDLRDK